MSGVWRVWDGLESVSLEIVRGSQIERRAIEVVPVSQAKRRAISIKERQASGGAYTGNDLNWWIPVELLPDGLEIKPGDAVVDNQEVRWVAQESQWVSRMNRWKLVCRNLVLHWQLRDTITIERATIEYDPSGAAVKRWPTGNGPLGGKNAYASLPARVQLLQGYDADARGVLGTENRYDVIVGRQVVVSREDRVRLASGVYLDILGFRQPERIDELPVLECVQRI